MEYRRQAEHKNITSVFPFDVGQICWTGVADGDGWSRHTRTVVDIQKISWKLRQKHTFKNIKLH